MIEIKQQASLFGVEQAQQKKKIAKKAVEPQKEQNSPLYDEVMRLGKSCNYIRLDVNAYFTIKCGIDGWWAYACLMNAEHMQRYDVRRCALKSIEQIKQAIQREAQS